eukprot:COSAG06_NODE_640_length_13515_cov_6.190206_5_plen_215_part_00
MPLDIYSPLWDLWDLWDFDVWRRQTALSGYNAFAVNFSEWGQGGRESQLGGVNPDHSPTHKRARGVVKWPIAAAGAPIASVLGKENARKSPSRRGRRQTALPIETAPSDGRCGPCARICRVTVVGWHGMNAYVRYASCRATMRAAARCLRTHDSGYPHQLRDASNDARQGQGRRGQTGWESGVRLFGGECKRPERAIARRSELGGVAAQEVRGL